MRSREEVRVIRIRCSSCGRVLDEFEDMTDDEIRSALEVNEDVIIPEDGDYKCPNCFTSMTPYVNVNCVGFEKECPNCFTPFCKRACCDVVVLWEGKYAVLKPDVPNMWYVGYTLELV